MKSSKKWQTFRDFRCYYEDDPRVKVSYNADVAHIAQRYTEVLRSFRFQTPGYHHIYVTVSSSLDHQKITPDHYSEDWLTTLQCGIAPHVINSLIGNDRHDYLVKLLGRCLKKICKRDKLNALTVREAEKLLLKYRTKVETIYLVKETTRWRVTITLQIAPEGKQSFGFLEYFDKNTNQRGKVLLTPMSYYDELHWIAKSVVVMDGKIIVQPRTSRTAKWHTKRYKVPFKFKISDLLAGSHT